MPTLKLQQPPGFYVIAWGELCERFSYYGAQTLLVLYLTKVFSMSDNESYSLFGAYATFAYALPIVGGILADRLLTLKQIIIIGGLLLIIGNLLMAVPHLNYFYIGLALSACGIGLYKPNSASLVGKLYKKHGTQQESGFTLFYMGMNIGAAASPFMYGFIGSYHYSYLISAAVLFISWVGFIINNHRIILNSPLPRMRLRQHWFAYLLIIFMCSLVSVLFLYPKLLSDFLLIFAPLVLLGLGAALFKYETLERNRLLALLILSVFGMCFFAASLQIGSSVNLFIQRDIDRTLFGWEIPTIMFTSLYPLAVIVAVPFMLAIWSFLARYNKEPTIPTKLSISLFLVSGGFICFVVATLSSQQMPSNHFPILWILLGNLALGMGEICLGPSLLTAISRLAPANLQSTMIGVWYLFIALGGYFSSLLAKWSSHQDVSNRMISSAIYGHTFSKIAVATFLLASLLVILIPWIKSLMSLVYADSVVVASASGVLGR